MEKTFVDEVRLFLKAGKGGDGLIVSRRLPSGRFVNNGGSGGRGGNVYIYADKSLADLSPLLRRRRLNASPGEGGGRGNKTGAAGSDLTIKVPLGTQVKTKEGEVLADLVDEGQVFLAARGGRGGLGNFRRRVNESLRRASRGEAGEEKELVLDYRIPAEVALVGFTNTGKSSFLSRFTSLKAKVSPFPFTTRYPLRGAVKAGFSGFRVIELPAVGEMRFKNNPVADYLKHLERVKVIILFQDVSCSHPENFFLLNRIISSYNSKYLEKKVIKVVNKLDSGPSRDNTAVGLSLYSGRGWNMVIDRIKQALGLGDEEIGN